MIRVDQAGELGANWIYKGQKLVMEVLGDKATAKQVEVSSNHCSTVTGLDIPPPTITGNVGN